MTEELEVLAIVTGRLESAQIVYMVTGSVAANYYAVPRMTRDTDIVVELSAADVDRLCDLFQGDFYLDRDMMLAAIAEQSVFNLIHMERVVKVDIIVPKDSEYRRAEIARRRRASAEGWEFFVAAPEDLIISKLEWARDRPLGGSDGRCPQPAGIGAGRGTSPAGSSGSASTACTGKWADEGHSTRDRREVSAAAALALRRGAPEDGQLDERDGPRAGPRLRARPRSQASPGTVRRELFLRFYGHEFDAEARERIAALLFRGAVTVPDMGPGDAGQRT